MSMMRVRAAIVGMVVVLSLGTGTANLVRAQIAQHAHLMMELGHGNVVASVAFSPDGRYVLTGSYDHTARLWDATTAKELRRFEGHSDSVTSIAFSPDARSVLTGSQDRSIRLWDISTGKELRRFEGHSGGITSVAFSPNGEEVLTGSEDHTALLWDTASGKQLRRFEGHSGNVNSVAFSPSGSDVLTGSSDHTARIWDVNSGTELSRFEGHSGSVTSVTFSSDGRRVLTGSEDGTARLWDVTSGTELYRFDSHSGAVLSVAFSPDERLMLTGNDDNTARLWDVAGRTEAHRFEGHSYPVYSVAFSSDGRYALTGSKDRTTRLWEVSTGKELRRFQGNRATVFSAVLSMDGHYVLTAMGDNTARIWDIPGGRQLHTLKGHSDMVLCVAFSPDGHYALTGSEDQSARLWDVQSGKELRRFEGHTGWVASVAFSPDGRHVLTGSWDHTARLWDVASGMELQRFDGHTDWVASVAFSPDGLDALTGSYDNTARLWNLRSGKELLRLEGHSAAVTSVAFSPNGRYLLTGSRDRTGRIWEASDGKELHRLVGHSDRVTSVAFSPDGRFVLTGSEDHTVRIWDSANGIEQHRLLGHSDAIYSVGVSLDGRYILTGSRDGTTRLWNYETNSELLSLISFQDGGQVVDPAGHYDNSEAADTASMYWVTDNLRTIELDQLKREYYTPGLLSRVMRGERLPDVAGMDTVSLPPVVSIVGSYSLATKTLPTEIKNDGGGVGKLLLLVNGRLLRTVDRPGTAVEGKSFTLPIDLSQAPFVEGDNTIRVAVYDASNRIESHEAVAHYLMPAPTRGLSAVTDDETLNAGKFYAIVVGTSTFGDPKMNLTFPARDAESFSTGLRLGAARLYGKENVWMRVLTSDAKSDDGLPTKKNIRGAFDEIRKLAKPEDTLVVYLSGHGAMSSKNRDLYYYLTADARTFDIENDPTLKDVSTVSSDELFEWLREPVKTMPLKQVVILDTCAAGGASETLAKLSEKRDIPPDQQRAIELLKDATGTFILMGSAADSVSYEASRYGEGLLTYALLQGMRGESLDDGSRLGVSRWFEKASEDTVDLAKSIGGIQKPVIAAPKGTGFPVALLTPEDRAKIPLAMPKPQLLRVVCEDENQDDPLNLRSLLREQLRALNYAQARGDRDGAEVMYLDATDDDLPGALQPKLRYEVSASKVSVRIRLTSGKDTVADETVSASAGDTQALAKLLAEKIVTMAVAKP